MQRSAPAFMIILLVTLLAFGWMPFANARELVPSGKARQLLWTLPEKADYQTKDNRLLLVFQGGEQPQEYAIAPLELSTDGEPFLLISVRVHAAPETHGMISLQMKHELTNTSVGEKLEAEKCTEGWQILQFWVNVQKRPKNGHLILGFDGPSGEVTFDMDSLTVVASQGIEIPIVERTPQLSKDVEILRERLRQRYLQPQRDITDILRQYQPDGTFSQVNYQSQNRSNWLAMRHLDQTLILAQAWANPESKFYHDARTAEYITGAFAWWMKHTPRNPNWWWNEIALPVRITRILLLTPELISAADRKIALRLCRCISLRHYTGQNLVDGAINILNRGLVEDDLAVIASGIHAIQSEIRFSPPSGMLGALEGIRRDGCYHQHGPQIQFGGYGLSFLNCIATWAELFARTTWQLDVEKWEIMRHLVFDGYQWTLWKGRMDLLVGGRHMQGDTGKTKGNSALKSIQRLSDLDVEASERYEQVIQRNKPSHHNDLVGSRWFWNSDLMIHRRPEWMAVMRACSTRVHPMEDNINQDCALGRYFADGTCLIYRHGEEYVEMPAVWDWTRLPGTTLPAIPVSSTGKQRFTLSANGFRNRGNTAFVGGGTDGTHACAIYNMNLDEVTAKKAYFFDDDAIYELGTDINSSSPFPVATTINSCRLRNEVAQGDGWVHHDGIGYVGKGLEVTTGDRTGDERILSGALLEESLKTLPVFHLQIDHGMKPQNASYCVAILPDATREETARRNLDNILSNTPELQAVRMTDGTIAAVFHSPGTLDHFATDSPGVFLIHGHDVHVADPTQQLSTMMLTLDGQTQTITLPADDLAGTTFTVHFQPCSTTLLSNYSL